MNDLTPEAVKAVTDLSRRYGISDDAVRTLLFAVSAGGGTMAQFYHSDIGGGGQWMRGGMTMVGDMFNDRLRSSVAALCGELSVLLASIPVFSTPLRESPMAGFSTESTSRAWWPEGLGPASSTGSQNDARYAVFAGSKRLAVSEKGRTTVYDTLDHAIGGVQQQQGAAYGTLSFTSERGTFTVDSLPVVVSPEARDPQPSAPQAASENRDRNAEFAFESGAPRGRPHEAQSSDDILASIERLGALHRDGILSDEEFRAKKAELLARL